MEGVVFNGRKNCPRLAQATVAQACRNNFENIRRFAGHELVRREEATILESLNRGAYVRSNPVILETGHIDSVPYKLFVIDAAIYLQEANKLEEVIYTASQVIGDCSNLENVNLSLLNLPYVNLSGKSVINVDFSGTRMPGAIFTNANIRHSNFSFTYMPNADFSDAVILDTDMQWSCVRSGNFHQAFLRLNTSSCVDFGEANFRGAMYDTTIFAKSIAVGAKTDNEVLSKYLNGQLNSTLYKEIYAQQQAMVSDQWKS